MDGFFSNIIPLLIIISIIFSIVNKSKKASQKSAESQATNSSAKPASIREIILQQIEAQKVAMQSQTKAEQKPVVPTAPTPVYGEGKSLEGTPTEMQRHSHNAHINESYNEGDALNRTTLENVPTEMQKYTNAGRVGGSYNEGDVLNRKTLEGVGLEGLASHNTFNDLSVELDVGKVEKRIRRPKVNRLSGGDYKALKLNRDSIVNGIIMTEVLNKRGGRRQVR